MSKPKLFVGSSQQNLQVAQAVRDALGGCDAQVWNEGVFGLNDSSLETLLRAVEEYAFAVFVLAPDDQIVSKDQTQASPRDNVLFESGLFMGVLGRKSVFLICDHAAGVKIPSDLEGITLAEYDGGRFRSDPKDAIENACKLITQKISEPLHPHLMGSWQSRYPATIEPLVGTIDEEVEITRWRDGLSIVSTTSSDEDYYSATGKVHDDRQIYGIWRSRVDQCDSSGTFMLTVSPNARYMYGYFTSPDPTGGLTYAAWVLAKKVPGAPEEEIKARLAKAEALVASQLVPLSSAAASPPKTH